MAANNTIFLNSQAGRRWHDMAYWCLLLVACAVFYWMNLLTPFKEDDMLHSLVIGELSPVNTFGDLMRSWWNKFFITNGRTSDMIAELFCGLLGKPLFNVCNAVMFGLLVHVVSLLSTGRHSLLAQGMMYACIGTCYPVPGETMLWLAGSCNYLWTITASLWLVYYLLQPHRNRFGVAQGILLFMGAMLAGAGNEAMSFGTLGGMVFYCIVNRHRVDRRMMTGLAGYLAGVLLILSSPAAWERASDGGIVVDLPFVDLLMSRCYIVGEKMVRLMVPLAAIAVGVVTLLSGRWKSFKSSPWPYIFVMITLVLLLLGLTPERPYAPLVTVSLIVVVLAVDKVLSRWPWLRLAVILLTLAIGGYSSARGVDVLRRYKVHDDQVMAAIKSAPDQVVLQECPFKGYSRFLYPLAFKSNGYFSNEYIWRAYFKKENVQFVSDSIYTRFNEHRLLDGAVEMPFSSDRPDLSGTVMAFPDQDYMILPLAVDTLPTAYQVGFAYWGDVDESLSQEEQSYRRQHALKSTNDPFGYYPLRYDGKVLMVLPLMNDNVLQMLLLLDYAGENLLNLYREGPNPAAVKLNQSS